MNQLVTNKTDKKMIMRQTLRKRKPRLVMRAAFLALCALIFAVPAMAQQNVYMHTGSSTLVGNDVVKFYDSGGESSGPSYYWERWFLRNEDYTYTFKAATGYKVKVTFKQFTAYTDNNSQNPAHVFTTHPMWALRLNTAELSIYDGMTTDADNLITTYTGSVIDEFTVMSNGSMTFHFKSYGYREEGWYAEVQQVPDENYAIQKPAISFQVCDDQIVINPNNKDVKVYYTTDGSDPSVPSKDPLSAGILYEGPFSVSVGTEVRAIAYDETLGLVSGVASLTYTQDDVTPTPGKPTITRTGNTITMEPAPLIGDINETYEAWYTTEAGGVYTKYTGPIEWNTPNTTFYAITKPVSCSDKISADTTLLFDKVQVPDPTITFTDIDENTGEGTVTITCEEGYVISYTIDGSDPATTGGVAGPITLANVAPGTTVKAIAYKVTNGALDPNYKPSDIVTLLCLPDGEGESGVYGGVVILDDREDHSWSYYSDGDQPVHSLEPRDIKITYYGNSPAGRTTMTNANESGDTPTSFSATATGVKVGIASTENQDQFIYLKTLEKDETSGNYPYTAIPNPFQVRPMGQSSTIPNPTRNIYLTTDSNNSNTTGTLEVTYYDSNGVQQTQNITIGYNYSYTTIEVKAGTNVSFRIRKTNNSNYNNRGVQFTAKYDDNNGTQFASSNGYYTSTSWSSSYGPYTIPSSGNITVPGYRGFYAWRIKSLSDGLTISGKQVGSLVYADEEITFNTSKEEGNEVELEALWAQAYLTTSTSTSGLVSAVGYERNFMVLNNASGTSVSGLTVPCTVSAYYPDGTNGSTTSYISGTITSGADLKIENIKISGNNSTMNANTHDLIIGRGVTPYSTRCASMVEGVNGASSADLDYTLRIESGTYKNLSCVFGTYDTYSSTVTCSGNILHVNAILGSDYDRAKGTNNTLNINESDSEIEFASGVDFSNIDLTSNTLFMDIKSGTIGKSDLEIANYGVYIGVSRDDRAGVRKLLVEGGNISNIAGGIDAANSASGNSVFIRMKGGTVRGAIYGSGSFAAASGNRWMVITGGKVGGWIAAGCNGTSTTSSGGVLPSDTYIYIGGDAEVGNKDGSTPVHINTSDGGNVFGAGSGNTTFETTGQVNNSNVVIADSCYVQNNVFGGGNYGYTSETANIHILGGTIGGSVFGGSNQKLGNVTNITMRDGTVTNNIYGGSNITGTVGGLATVNVYGGTVTNVYGGGCGAATIMNSGTVVNINGGTINNNVYGGGEEGEVHGDTHVNISGGTMKDVYGAGKGGNTTAQVSGKTYVTVSGGTISESVYGGGEAGDVMADNQSTPSTGETILYDFESGSLPTGWTTINNDNDSYNWSINNNNAYNNSNYCMRSSSYYSAQDNWLVSPKFALGGSFSFYAKRGNSTGDKFIVYVSQQGTSINNFTAISGTITPGTSYSQYTYDLSEYAGTEGYVAIRHYTTSDYYYLYVDNVEITLPADDPEPQESDLASYVTVSGGSIAGDVFGGGKRGLTQGNVQVNVEGGSIRGNVFGGAYGDPNQVFVAGVHTVNIMGGRVFGSVYGGSRNANDALAFTGYDENETQTSSVLNISAGQIDQQVYTAGYYGKTFGSVYTFIGTNAILNAPHSAPSFDTLNDINYKAGNLRLGHNVWAGGDWGVFTSGSFGAPTVSGYSDIYVDGTGYNTVTTNESAPTYMNIAGSIFGCGTSCDAGTQGRAIVVRNYGQANGSGSKNDNFPEPYSDATRTLYSIQRADTLVLDNAHINFTGHAKIYTLDATEKYAINSFDKTVRIVGGSSLFMNAPTSQIKDWWNASCDDVYQGVNATYTPVAYNQVAATPNKIRVNGGNYIEVYHDKQINSTTGGYGMLNGFAYMMVSDNTSENTCAYARPKQCQDTPINNDYDNPNDGGWVSYDSDKNTFDIDGNSHNADGVTLGPLVQMPYENHINNTKNGEQYFRIWRAGGKYSEREAVVNILANGTNTFGYVDVSVKLPAWRSNVSYYKFQTTGQGANLNTTIEYGADVMMYNSALIGTSVSDSASWVRFNEHDKVQQQGTYQSALNEIRDNPNVNFGLVALAGTAMSGSGLLVCNESDAFLAKVVADSTGAYQTVNKFTCGDFEKNPEVTFRFTYSNLISTNMTWDPMYITLVQVDENGEQDIVKIAITINVATTIDREFVTQTYAIMNGTGSPNDEYVAKLVLPTFDIYDPLAEHLSQFKLDSVRFEPESDNDAEPGSWIARGGYYNINHFAMEISAANNEDNSDGWNGTSTGFKDSKTNMNANGLLLGETGGREPFAFDFRLTYKGDITFDGDKPRLGMLTFYISYDNVKVQTGTDPSGDPIYASQTRTLIIKVDVIRRGKGTVFYLDGQHGSNANDARHPDKAALSLSTIFNRCGYLPGDIIYIVNQVDVDDDLEWSGTRYNNVIIYRYPGGHPLSETQLKNSDGQPLYVTPAGDTTTVATGNTAIMIIGEIVGNENNLAYEGALINVQDKGNLVIRDITLDGHMTAHESPFSTTQNPKTDGAVEAESPMIVVSSGGLLTLTTGTTLQENNSTTNGGGVAVNDGGTLMMNDNAAITNNKVTGNDVNGGAVYMAGTLIVSDSIQLINNTNGTTANNVCLAGADNVIQIGTTEEDDFGPLTQELVQLTNAQGQPLYYTNSNQTETTTQVTNYPVMYMVQARIGVTKELFGNVDGYTEIVYVEDANDIAWLEPPFNDSPNSIIFDDGGVYQLEKYKYPQYLYWIGTWVTRQYWNPHYTSDTVAGYDPNNFEGHLKNIHTPEELAWLISYVNGLNGADRHPNAVATITDDIDMQASIWVPIGNANVAYKGTFEGNGHVIEGIHSILVNSNAGMFGVTDGATIQNVVAQVYFNGNSINKGTFIGTMNGGKLANVEAAGTLIGKENTVNMGGLVGLAMSREDEHHVIDTAIIHSGFSVNTITAENSTTVVGGLVGSLGDIFVEGEDTTRYYADLYNSYANVTLGTENVATKKGGLVGINHKDCTVENCYVINPINNSAVFAFTNDGTVQYCYAADGTGEESLFVDGSNTAIPGGYGTYEGVKGRKELGYMYGDNFVNAQTTDTTYIRSKLIYDEHKIDVWRGLVSTLNQWVDSNPHDIDSLAPWYRPTTDAINGDLPILGFEKDNSLATEDGKFLRYSSNINSNGLDSLFTNYMNKTVNMFLYGNATNVTLGNGNNMLYINEDAVLLQKVTSNMPEIRATVGITFDNSDHGQNSVDYYGDTLYYDWHMMSTPLRDATLGATYDTTVTMAFGTPVNITQLQDSYFPNGLITANNPAVGGDVKWDLYSYYEPEYHWINLKRSTNNHWHIDGDHGPIVDADSINYQNETIFVPGKGYMMAINQDSYLSSSGVLNTGGDTIVITNQEPEDIQYNRGWNLVGNPYQAYLDLSKVGSGPFYIYDAGRGMYVPYASGRSRNPITPSQYIHPHQAFFMHTSSETQNFVFDYTWATDNKDEESYFRGGEDQLNYPLVNLIAENQRGNRDLTIIEFNRPELGGATKVKGLRNANFRVAASLYGQNYGILFTPEGTEKVPVHFLTEQDGIFTLRWSTYNGNFTSLRLIDNKTGVNYDMLANDHYTFEASADDYASRFYITYTCTGVDEEVSYESDNFAFFNGSEWIINGKGQLDVIDMTGRVLYATKLNNDQNRVHFDGVAAGVYLLRVNDNKVVRTQKIIVR